jgi:hypothetical protein
MQVRASDFAEEWPAFDAAFGRFIRSFGRTETILALGLEMFVSRIFDRTELTVDIVRALVGSRRTPELAKATDLCLKAAAHAKVALPGGSRGVYNDERVQMVATAYAHLAEIRFLRDRTAHFSIGVDKDQHGATFSTSTRWTVNDIDKAERIVFCVKHLEAAADDLLEITKRVEASLFWSDNQISQRQPEPWRYKPSELVHVPYPG